MSNPKCRHCGYEIEPFDANRKACPARDGDFCEAREPTCGECGFLLSKHPERCVYAGTAEQRARGEVTP